MRGAVEGMFELQVDNNNNDNDDDDNDDDDDDDDDEIETQFWLVEASIYRDTTNEVISMEFLQSLLRRHLAGKPASPNVGCFPRLNM